MFLRTLFSTCYRDLVENVFVRIKPVSHPTLVESIIFSIPRVLSNNHTFRRSLLSVLLGLKTAFSSVCRTVLWCCLSLKDVPENSFYFADLCMPTASWIYVYDDLSLEFTTTSGLRQGCPLSRLVLDFFSEITIEVALFILWNSGIDIHSRSKLSDFEHSYSDDLSNLQALFSII